MKKILGVLSAALLAAVTLKVTPAYADVSISAVTLSTNTVILDGDAGCADRIKVTVQLDDPPDDSTFVVFVEGDAMNRLDENIDWAPSATPAGPGTT